jgi:hypothetical protein
MFGQFQTALRSTPLAWRAIAQAQQQGVKGFHALVLEQAQSIGQQKLLNEAHKAAINLLRQEEASWQRIKRGTAGAAVNIRDMTSELMKWTKLTTVVSGLLGAGGLFGITRLAENVAGGRRSSLGLGTTYGGQKAFDTAFDRFGDPASILAGVEDARTDITKRTALYGAGLGEKDLTGDTSAVAARVLAKVQQLAKSTPDALLASVYGSRHLGDAGISMETFRTLKRTSYEEMAQQQGRFGKLSGEYGVGNADQRAYQEFVTTLTDAGNQIETVFVKGLAPLIKDGSINELSKSVVDLVKAFSESHLLTEAIHDVTESMRGLADFMKNPLGAAKTAVTNELSREGEGFSRDWQHIKGFWSRGFGGGGSGAGAPAGAAGVDATTGLPMKAGAGRLDPGLAAFAQSIRGKVSSFDQITAGEDDYHKAFKSAHNDGRAFDFTIKNPADAAAVADLVRTEMAKQGIKGRVIDEYNHPSKNATGGHIHVQTDVRVMNAAGSNVIVQAQQAAPSP